MDETAFVLEEGLTVAGKPLKDHQEVVGLARAIDLLYKLLEQSRPITDADLFDLHRAVQTEVVTDIYSPPGSWKQEPNGTHATTPDGKQVFIDYAVPADVPALMADWLELLNHSLERPGNEAAALAAYADLHMAFVRVHPFFDGNGRMARLLANLPVLKAGYPPILIDRARRRDYLQYLSGYDLAVGTARAGLPLLPQSERLETFRQFCRKCWRASLELVEQARLRQAKRLKPTDPPE